MELAPKQGKLDLNKEGERAYRRWRAGLLNTAEKRIIYREVTSQKEKELARAEKKQEQQIPRS